MERNFSGSLMRIAVLQTNPILGDPRGNAERISALLEKHVGDAEIFVTPELALIGYPARDLLSEPRILKEEQLALDNIRATCRKVGAAIFVGHTTSRTGLAGKPLWNSASLIVDGEIVGTTHKVRIPSYDIFDEDRYFESGSTEVSENPHSHSFGGLQIHIAICEDGWSSIKAHGSRDIRNYDAKTSPFAHHEDFDLHINMSASPFSRGKHPTRLDLFGAQAARNLRPLLYVNCAGAQDNIIFDGGSFACAADGSVLAQAPRFEEGVWIVEFDGQKLHSSQWIPSRVLPFAPTQTELEQEPMAEVFSAIATGISDYFRKTGFEKAVLGLSGGIDSALTISLASAALGAKNLLGVSLPSSFTSTLSKTEAIETAKNLGAEFRELSIASVVESAQATLSLKNSGLPFENLQSRARGLLLMGISNNENRLLFSTANKSELAMGYGTLYGDLCGALLPLGDLYKSEVYELARYVNALFAKRGFKAPIPEQTITRPPTAELAPGQTDQDSLPPYDLLDALLKELIENQGELIQNEAAWNEKLGAKHTVGSIRRRLHLNEYKRQQAAPILRLHQRAFGRGWTYPIAKKVFS